MNGGFSSARQTVRSLLSSPDHALTTVLTLAVGIAATTIIFSAYYHVIVRPLPFEDWHELIWIFHERDAGGHVMSIQPSPQLVIAARETSTTLAGLEGWVGSELAFTGIGEPTLLRGARITPLLTELVGVQPLLGRSFTVEEAQQGARVILLGENLWRGRFGADPLILGAVVRLGGEQWTVIGVMPSHFSRFEQRGSPHEFWLPLRLSDVQWGLSSVARLRPGVADEAVTEELAVLQASIPGPGGDDWVFALKRADELSGAAFSARTTLPRLFAAAALLMLTSCANVGGLLLVRLHRRMHELAMRAALGASRGRLLVELAMEQAVVGVAAGVVGGLLASWGLDVIRAFRPDRMAHLDNVVMSLPVLAFAAASVLLTTILLGALPALYLQRRDLAAVLAGVGRVTSRTRTRNALVTLQLALSTMLLVGGLLLVRTVHQLEHKDLGFDPSNVLVVQIPLPDHYFQPDARQLFMNDLAGGVREIPGVRSAALATSAPPLVGLVLVQRLEVEGSDVSTEGITAIGGGTVGPGFFSTVRGRILEGREFRHDTDSGAVIVNRAFVDRFWPGESGIGRRFRTRPQGDWHTITAVVSDMSLQGPLSSSTDLTMFSAMTNVEGLTEATLLIRTAGDPLAVAPALRQVIAARAADLPIRMLEPMESRMAGAIATQRFNMIMLGMFACAAVLLCVIGLYGLVSYNLQERTREIGVRLALGATPAAVRALFVSQALRLVAVGVPLGLAMAMASTHLMSALVHGVTPQDPIAFLAAALIISAIVVPAAWLPARRAERVQPLDVLRHG